MVGHPSCKIRLPFAVVGAAAFLLLAPSTFLFAQREAAKQPLPGDLPRLPAAEGVFTPLIVNQSGGVDGRAVEEVALPARDLSMEEKSSLLASLGHAIRLGGSGPWKVTSAAAVAGPARLGFQEAEYVSAGGILQPTPLARIHGRSYNEPHGSVGLWVTASAPGERYLIDCKVSPTGTLGLRFSGPGSSVTVTNTEHLIAIYEAADTGAAYFSISRPSETYSGSGDTFTFYACEITRLQ